MTTALVPGQGRRALAGGTIPRHRWATIIAFHLLFQWCLLPGVHLTALVGWTDAALCTLAPLIAACWCYPRGGRAGAARMWDASAKCFAAGLLLFAVGQALYYHALLVRHVVPFPSLADVALLASYPFLTAGALLRPARHVSSPAARGRVLMDSVMVLTAAGTFVWYFLIGPVILAGAATTLGRILAPAYPVLDLVVLCCFLMVSAAARNLRRPGAFAVTAGLLLVTVADVAFGLRNLRGEWSVLTEWDGLWVLGYLLLGAGVGALALSPPAKADGDGCDNPVWDPHHHMAAWRPLLPYGLIPAVGVLVVYTALRPDDDLLGRGVYAGSAVLFVLVLLRQVLSIRENVRLNALLWESRERYRLASRATNDVLWDWDPTTNALYCSDAFTTAYGYPDRVVADGFEFFRNAIHPDDRQWVLSGFRTALDGDSGSWSDEYRFRRADGTYAAVLDRGFIVRDADGRAVRMIGSMLDLTPRERAAELERERTSLTAAVTAMDQVLGVVGHELRTPLAGARAISELLLNSEVRAGDQAQEMLTGLHDEVVRMSDTIDALLEAARLNSGRATWNWSRFPVGQVCLEAADSLRALVDPRRVALQVDVAPLGAEMLGDAEAVRRLILNLLSNARKHTERGFIRVEVRAETDDAGGHSRVRIVVSDSGPGIEPDVLARLGQAFALNSGVVGSRYVGGTGLGLAICKGIVQVHGGNLTVRSEVGQGTTVVVWLRSDLGGPEPLTRKSGFTSEQCADDATEAL